MITQDIEFVQSILPDDYTIEESKKKGSIHCYSRLGIDDEDTQAWNRIMDYLKIYFAERLQEIFHNTCFYHKDFTIYIKQRK